MTDAMKERAAKVAESYCDYARGQSSYDEGRSDAAAMIASAIRALPPDPTRAALEQCVKAMKQIIEETPHPQLFERTVEGREAFIERLKNIARAPLATARNALDEGEK